MLFEDLQKWLNIDLSKVDLIIDGQKFVSMKQIKKMIPDMFKQLECMVSTYRVNFRKMEYEKMNTRRMYCYSIAKLENLKNEKY